MDLDNRCGKCKFFNQLWYNSVMDQAEGTCLIKLPPFVRVFDKSVDEYDSCDLFQSIIDSN